MENYFWSEEAPTEAWHYLEPEVAAVNEDIGSISSLEFPCNCLPLPPDGSNLYMHGYSLSHLPTSFQGVKEDRSTASASKSHSQAEKRRRDRINAHLATLRKLIPKSDKVTS